MFIVGMKAVPDDASTELKVGDLATGFVQSWLWVVDTAAVPDVQLESDGSGALFQSINLNRDYAFSPLKELTPGEALAQPTGLAIVESGNVVQKIIMTAFSSDNVAMLVPDASEDSGWKITRLNLGVLGSYSMVGPRDVVVNDAGTRAYVFCSMDNSLRTLDISGTSPLLMSSASLEFDDTPANIRAGREFLYASKHSGNNMVSCSSCHIDGHTDALSWELNQDPQGTIPPELKNHVYNVVDPLPTEWIADKGPLVTQTLRGLVNHDVPGNPQVIFTNAPYHWRGDRASFQAFNGAFVDLMNRPMGELIGTEIDAFTEFVETMNLPPNPEQALDRRLTGGLGGSPNDPNLGTSQLRGMKIFHAHPFPVSCAHCHVLPEGSGNRITQTFNNRPGHAVEPAALRHIFDRESLVVLGDASGSASQYRVKKFGLFHDGLMNGTDGESINHFSDRFTMSATDATDHDQQRRDLSNFIRSLDTGTAPAIGYAYTMTGVQGPDLVELRFFLDQVGEANIGWVVHTTIGGTPASHWFDLVSVTFKDDLTSGTMSLLDVLNHAGNNELVVLQAVPVGSARRIADYGRLGLEDSGTKPLNVTMQPMTPPTQWEDSGGLVSMWDPANPLVNFPTGSVATGMDIKESHDRMIHMQQALIDAETNNGFVTGIDSKKHEIPRRFRVAGDNIRHGALLTIFMPTGTGSERLTMQLHPTKYKSSKTGPRVWETTVAADGEMTLAFLNGGYYHPPVNDLLFFVQPYPVLNPTMDNSYTWAVSNTDGTLFVGNSELTVRHDRQ